MIRAVMLMALTLVLAPVAAANGQTYLGCGYRQEFTISAHPRHCFLDWPDLPLAGAIDLQRITWRRWGRLVATGTAVWRTKIYDPWSHVKVRAYKRRSCGRGRLYTRVGVYGDGWQRSWRTMRCSDVPVDR